MTARELIAQLQQMDPDMEVVCVIADKGRGVQQWWPDEEAIRNEVLDTRSYIFNHICSKRKIELLIAKPWDTRR